MYKMVAIDLDGTLLNSEKQISEENLSTIQKAIDKDVKIVVCSGRIFAGAKIFAKQIHTKEPLIACNGALIREINTEETLYADFMGREDCGKVVDICHCEGLYFHVYIDNTMYTEKLDFSSLSYWKKNQKLPEEDRVDIRLVEDMLEALKGSRVPPAKIVIVSRDLSLLSRVRERVEKIETVDVMSSNFNNFEVVNRGVNKGQALKFLSEKYKIDRSEIIAIGDNENDYSMMQFSGLAVAMGNAENIIKEAADYITLTNNQNGVAEAIKKFVL